jgi:3-demethoxyubiquinol 3-hydroxylase
MDAIQSSAIQSSVPCSDDVSRRLVQRADNSSSLALDIKAVRRLRAAKPFPKWLAAELRSDHAGEVGAVEIYRGALAANRDAALQTEILSHLETERRHLRAFQVLLDPAETSRVLSLWRKAGWLLGYIGCRAGQDTYHRTIAAVETFVDTHYGQQIRRLSAEGGDESLLALLRACQRDEIEHRNQAASSITETPGILGRFWITVVGAGSAAAVALARRI